MHVVDVGLLSASDEQILIHAADQQCVIVTADADFGMLLATRRLNRPSVVLLRSADHLSPERQAILLAANLSGRTDDLDAGAILTIARGRLRLRRLPIGSSDY